MATAPPEPSSAPSPRGGHDRSFWDERYSARAQTFPPEPNRLVVAEVGAVAPGRALDLATGEGRHAVWLASLGWQVVAVDFSGVGLAKAQSRARAANLPVAFVQADVHELRYPPASFDLVLASFFHPLPTDERDFYRRVAASLRPGGTLLIVGYDIANLSEGSGGPPNPDLLVRPAELGARLAGAGLEVRRAEAVRLRATNAEGEEVDVVDAVIRAVQPAGS